MNFRKLPTVLMMALKIGPALATNGQHRDPETIRAHPSARGRTRLSCEIPPGVFSVLVGYSHTAGVAISEHMQIDKVAFTGGTVIGMKIMEATARINLKNVRLELEGKSPNVIFDDADLDQAIKWASHGILCVIASSSLLLRRTDLDDR